MAYSRYMMHAFMLIYVLRRFYLVGPCTVRDCDWRPCLPVTCRL